MLLLLCHDGNFSAAMIASDTLPPLSLLCTGPRCSHYRCYVHAFPACTWKNVSLMKEVSCISRLIALPTFSVRAG